MGLFGPKKTCTICGGKVGLLGYKLAGGQHLCSDCRTKCTPGSNLEFSHMTAQDVRSNMELADANKKKGATQFQATRQFYCGANRDKPVIFVDETHGWFMNAAKNDGWVYNLSDISYYNMRLSTSKQDEDKKQSFLEFLFSPDFYSSYPELPQCPYGEKIIGAYLTLRLLDNELGIDKIEFDVFPGLFTSESDVRGSYECCHEFYEFMQTYRMNQNNARQSDPAAAPAASEADSLETLKKLHELLDAGILTQEEFDAKKKQILGL